MASSGIGLLSCSECAGGAWSKGAVFWVVFPLPVTRAFRRHPLAEIRGEDGPPPPSLRHLRCSWVQILVTCPCGVDLRTTSSMSSSPCRATGATSQRALGRGLPVQYSPIRFRFRTRSAMCVVSLGPVSLLGLTALLGALSGRHVWQNGAASLGFSLRRNTQKVSSLSARLG